MQIKYLKNCEIDKKRWDGVITASGCGLPYCHSWYLDVVCAGWEALIADDYKVVMPLPVKSKFGIKYLIEPKGVQQMGVFFADDSLRQDADRIISEFVKAIPYYIYDFNLGDFNSIDVPNCTMVRKNMVLDLNCGVGSLRNDYKNNTKRNIRIAENQNLTIVDLSLEQMTNLWLEVNEDKYGNLLEMFPRIFSVVADQGMARMFGVCREGELVAGLFAIETNGRIIYFAPVSTAHGKECRAMFFLVDRLLEKYAGSSKLWDFEGSMIEGVAKFYLGFGAKVRNYARISRGRSEKLVSFLKHLCL